MEQIIDNSPHGVPYRPLGLITNAVESAGFKTTFVYEDLNVILSTV